MFARARLRKEPQATTLITSLITSFKVVAFFDMYKLLHLFNLQASSWSASPILETVEGEVGVFLGENHL